MSNLFTDRQTNRDKYITYLMAVDNSYDSTCNWSELLLLDCNVTAADTSLVQ